MGGENFLVKEEKGKDKKEKNYEVILVGNKHLLDKYEEFKAKEKKVVERQYEDGTKERVTKHSIVHMKTELKEIEEDVEEYSE
jgi:hypothetical protein